MLQFGCFGALRGTQRPAWIQRSGQVLRARASRLARRQQPTSQLRVNRQTRLPSKSSRTAKLSVRRLWPKWLSGLTRLSIAPAGSYPGYSGRGCLLQADRRAINRQLASFSPGCVTTWRSLTRSQANLPLPSRATSRTNRRRPRLPEGRCYRLQRLAGVLQRRMLAARLETSPAEGDVVV